MACEGDYHKPGPALYQHQQWRPFSPWLIVQVRRDIYNSGVLSIKVAKLTTYGEKISKVSTFNSIENDEFSTKVKKLAAITIHNCSQKRIKQRIAGGGVQWRVTSDDGRGW